MNIILKWNTNVITCYLFPILCQTQQVLNFMVTEKQTITTETSAYLRSEVLNAVSLVFKQFVFIAYMVNNHVLPEHLPL